MIYISNDKKLGGNEKTACNFGLPYCCRVPTVVSVPLWFTGEDKLHQHSVTYKNAKTFCIHVQY